jgi:hypothetical protein
MKAIVFLALIALSQAAYQQFYYAGTTNDTTGGTSPQANYAIIDINGACTASATPSGYQMFTINATTNAGPTFYWVTAMFQNPTVRYAQVQVYNGRYTPATPCGNITAVKSSSSGAPHVSVLVYLAPGLHDVVVTTTSELYAGVFAVHADRAQWTAATTNASPYMLQQFTSTSSCGSYSTGSPYVYYQWTAAATEVIDVIAFSYNNTMISNTFVASLYNSSQLAFLGTGNITNPADGCVNAYWIDAVGEESSYTKISQNYFAAAIFVGVQQVQGQNYTIILSGYNTDENYIYGVLTRPSLQGFLGTQQNYNRPTFGSVSNGDTCDNSSSTYYWYPVVFTAAFSTYVVDNGYGAFDTAACLYSGNNLGSADMTVPPLSCSVNWLQCIDTGDVGPLHQLGTAPGANYTIVQTTYSSGGGGPGAEYTLWIYTGTQLGPLPVTTTAVATTAAMSSSASMVVASLALIFAAFFF